MEGAVKGLSNKKREGSSQFWLEGGWGGLFGALPAVGVRAGVWIQGKSRAALGGGWRGAARSRGRPPGERGCENVLVWAMQQSTWQETGNFFLN